MVPLVAFGALLVLAAIIAVFSVLLGEQRENCAQAGVAGGGVDEPGLSPMQVAVRVYEVGATMAVPQKHLLSAFETVIVEAGGNTTMANPMCYSPGECDRDSVGAFQQRNISPWTDHGRNRRNVRDASRTFYEQAALEDHSSMTPGELADAVQVSAFPYKYDQVEPVARKFLNRVLALSPTQFASLAGGGETPGTQLASASAQGGGGGTFAGRRGGTYADRGGAGASSNPLVWPTVEAPITSGYGWRWGRLHAGIDIAPPQGEPIYAAAAGVVTLRQASSASSGYGNYVCLRHGASTAAFTTCYAHMLHAPRPPMGATVKQGEVLGEIGSTGHSFGPHLHFEIREGPYPDSDPVDPEPALNGAEPPSGALVAANEGCAPGESTLAGLTGGELGWPLAERGELIGGPNVPGSTHDPATWPYGWQSDNALDIGVATGTAVLAVADGEVCRKCGFGSLGGSDPQLAGLRLTLDVAGNQVYYTHLSSITVRPGERVKRGQVIGRSGSANGVPHLHIAVRDGDPTRLFGQPAKEPSQESAA